MGSHPGAGRFGALRITICRGRIALLRIGIVAIVPAIVVVWLRGSARAIRFRGRISILVPGRRRRGISRRVRIGIAIRIPIIGIRAGVISQAKAQTQTDTQTDAGA